jgi:archaemetzincin
MPVCLSRRKLLLVSIGSINANVLQYLVPLLSERFKADVGIGSNISIELFHADQLRRQYLSTSMLRALRDIQHFDKVLLGVVDVDLYVPSLKFVFGEADPVNRVAVISITRLRPPLYGLEGDRLFLERVGKEAVHELGHVFHLKHCSQRRCVMFFSNSLADTDSKESEFCHRCRRSLAVNLL